MAEVSDKQTELTLLEHAGGIPPIGPQTESQFFSLREKQIPAAIFQRLVNQDAKESLVIAGGHGRDATNPLLPVQEQPWSDLTVRDLAEQL